jgi:hypothetical protein
MVEDDKCQRCEIIAKSAFPGKSLYQIVDQIEDDRDAKKAAAAKKEWDEAEVAYDKKLDGEAPQFDDDVEVNHKTRTGYRMSLKYGYITVTEFNADFGVDPKACGLKVTERWDEHGLRMLSGCAFRPVPGDELKYRVLENFYESVTEKHQKLMKASDRLRKKQPDDVCSNKGRQALEEHPAALSGRWSAYGLLGRLHFSISALLTSSGWPCVLQTSISCLSLAPGQTHTR